MTDEIISGLDKWAGDVVATILPRPPGAEPKDPAEAHQEWRDIKDDVQRLASLLQQRAAVIGPERAALEMLEWDKRHRGHEEEGRYG